jgi:cell division GTPase FtsZ
LTFGIAESVGIYANGEIAMAFEILETETTGTIIKVIGVGGAGGNAVEHMLRRGV